MKTLLVVDDEYEVTAAVRSILEDEGYKVEVCSDGREAIEFLDRGNVPHVVITDLMMPRVDGYALVEHLRKDKKLGDVPVLLMSGATPVKRPGARWDKYLRKPFSLESLLEAVHQLAEQSAGG